jgi:hypothetical protein
MEVRSVEAIVRALNTAAVEYLIVGGLAVNAYGFVRLTRDVDLVLQLDSGNVSKGLNALLDIGYQMSIPAKPEDFANPEMRESWRQTKKMITLKLWSDQHERTPVDISSTNLLISQKNTPLLRRSKFPQAWWRP